MKLIKKAFLSTVILLVSCNHASTTKVIMYENTFNPWSSDVDYSFFIDCNKSYFNCTYSYTYDYCLVYKNGNKVQFKGNYEYVDEKFILHNDEGTDTVLDKINYYRFKETVVYEEKEYDIIWHAKHIFD